jgi:hypothetical protein
LAGTVSVAIVWSEIVHNWNNPVLSLVGIVIRSTGRNWFLLEVRRSGTLLTTEHVDCNLAIHGLRHIFQLHAT